MRIQAIEVIPIRAPRKEAVRSAGGSTPVTASEFGIVRILADDGTEGLGEISITSPKIGFSLCHGARRLLVPPLLGQDARQLPRLLKVIDNTLQGELSAPYVRAAFEMALLDLIGKAAGLPVYQLLGGRAREAVPLAWSIYQKAPPEMAEDAKAGLDAGFKAIKLKVGRQLADDVAAVAAVAQAVGLETPLRLDANMAWRTVPHALNSIAALAAEATVAWVEQPLERHNLAGMALLRQRSGVPIMADESLQTLVDAYQVAQAGAADVFNVYVVEAGGLLAAGEIFAFASALDIPCILGSQAELGIGTAAAAHLGVAVSDLPYACETFGPLRYAHDIISPSVRIEKGLLYPPEGGGLGVTLDWAVVNEWRVEE
jgi:muconate cycloisomerase